MPQVGSASNFVFLNERSGSFTASQFVRVVPNEDSPSDIRPPYFQVSVFRHPMKRPLHPATQTALGSEEQTIWPQRLTLVLLSIQSVGRRENGGPLLSWIRRRCDDDVRTRGASSTIGEVGESVTFPLVVRSDRKVDDIISVSTKNAVGQDLFKVTVIGSAFERSVSALAKPRRDSQRPTRMAANPTVMWKFQPWVKVRNTGATFVVQFRWPSCLQMAFANPLGSPVRWTGLDGAIHPPGFCGDTRCERSRYSSEHRRWN